MKNKRLVVSLPADGYGADLLWTCQQLMGEFGFNNETPVGCWESGVVTLLPACVGVKDAIRRPDDARGLSYFNMALESAVSSTLFVKYTRESMLPTKGFSTIEINFDTGILRIAPTTKQEGEGT